MYFMKYKFLALVIAVVVSGLGVFVLGQQKQEPENPLVSEQTQEDLPLEQVVSQGSSGSAEEVTSKGVYAAYSESRVSSADAESKIILFFNASWCPTCQVAKKNFEENANNVPAGLVLLDVDYDSNQELRVKYGVTVQHTFVQVDPKGNLLKKWNGSYVIDQLLDQAI